MNSQLIQILRDLVASPNGRLFSVGSVLCIGSGYYIFDRGSEQITFAYVVLGLGSLMIIGSMIMVSFAKYMHEKQRLEIMRLDKELRADRMNHGEVDKTIYRVDDE